MSDFTIVINHTYGDHCARLNITLVSFEALLAGTRCSERTWHDLVDHISQL